MYKIRFRPLKVGDLDQILSLLSHFKESKLNIDVEELVADPKCHCVVGEINGNVVGFGALVRYNSPSKGEVGRIEDVIIDEEYRGKGFGKELLLELIAIANEENITQIDLTSNKTRTSARNLYISLGFKIRETDTFRLML